MLEPQEKSGDLDMLDFAERDHVRDVLLPRVEKLAPGDVILTSNVASTGMLAGKQASVIRRMTRGRFSHALVCSEPPTLIEAVLGGVCTLSLARCFVHSRANVRVLRHPDAGIASRAARNAQLEIGRDYSVSLAMRSIFPSSTIARIRDHGIFCSALVAQVFLEAGAVEFCRVPVDKTTPTTIDEMVGMLDVTDDVFVPGLEPRNLSTLTALDGDAVPTLSARQTTISKGYAKAMLPLAERIVTDFPRYGLRFSPTLYGLLNLILMARDARIQPGEAVAFVVAVDELDVGLARLLASGELTSLVQAIVRDDAEANRDMLIGSFEPNPDIDVGALSGLLEASRSASRSRRTAYEAILAAGAGRSLAVSEYLAVERIVLENLAARERLFEEVLERIGNDRHDTIRRVVGSRVLP